MSAVHTQTGPYMPKSDVGKRDWMAAFIKQIVDAPDHYGFAAEDVEYYQRVIGYYVDAFAAASNSATRTTCTVRQKNDTRSRAVELCRTLAMQIKTDPSLTDAQKLALGIHIDDATLTRVQQPRGFPRIVVQGAPTGGHTIRFQPRNEFGSNAKPNGVTHMLLYAAIGDEPNLGVAHARLIGAYTKQPFVVDYPHGSSVEGKCATYYGRWLTGKGDIGSWSPGVSMIIAAASVSPNDVNFAHLFGMEAPTQGQVGEPGVEPGVEQEQEPGSAPLKLAV